MAETNSFVLLKKHEGYAVLQWNRPARKNAIIPEMENQMIQYFKEVANDDSIKLVVLTGTGEYYTSGADFLTSATTVSGPLSEENVRANLQPFKNFVDYLIDFSKPIIVAVNGPAIGMGVSTLALCDVVYASSDATFLTPFSQIGMAPEACSSYTFPLIMGYSKATEMLVFNRTISASEARSCGLVSEVFPKATLMKEVYKRVEEFLDNPAKCLLYGKELMRKRNRDYLHRVNHEEVERLVERSMADDIKVQALKFIQKRMEIKERRKARL